MQGNILRLEIFVNYGKLLVKGFRKFAIQNGAVYMYHLMSREKHIQLNLFISNSLISNYRLSRSENLVPVLT